MARRRLHFSNSYSYDAATGDWVPYQHPMGMRANTNANVSTPAGQALVYGAGWGAIAAAISATLAIWLHWPWTWPLALTAATALIAGGGFAVWVARDERALQWQYAPPDPPEPAARPREELRFIKVRDRSPVPATANISDDLEIVSPTERARQAYSRDLRFFLRSVWGTGDASWRTWEKTTLPSGNTCSRSDWEQWCKALVDCGLAARPYTTAPLQLTGTYQDALKAFASLL